MNNTVVRLYNRTVTFPTTTEDVPYKRLSEISTYKVLFSLMHEVIGYTGALIRVINTTTLVELDIHPKSNGFLDTAALLAHAGVNDCEIMKWYDQMEVEDLIAGVGRRPKIVTAGVLNTNQHGQVAMQFNDTLFTSTMPYGATDTPVTISCIFETPSGSTISGRLCASDTSGDYGIELITISSDYLYINTNTTSGNYLTSNNTKTIEGHNRYGAFVHIKAGTSELFQDGISIDTSTALNANLDVGTAKWAVGDRKTTVDLPFNGTMQMIAVQLSDEKSNQSENFTEANPRYEIDGSETWTPETITIKLPKVVIETTGEYFSDTPELLPNGEYANGRIVGDINFNQQMYFSTWNRPNGGLGNVDLVGIDKKINHLPESDYNRIDVLKSDGTTLSTFGKADIDNIGFIEKGRIRISIKSALDKLNTHLPTELFDNTYPNLENERKMLVMGECYLVKPTLVDATTNKYFVSDNVHNIVTVYDRGKSVLFTQVTNGFTLNQQPNGKILVVAQGHTDGGTYEKYIGQHIARLLTNIDFEIVPTDFDGIYPTIETCWSGTSETVGDAIRELIDGLNMYMYVDEEARLRFGKLALPVSPTDTLQEFEVLGDIKAFKDRAATLSLNMSNNRNFNQFEESEIVYTALEADKVNFQKKYKTTAIGTGLDPFYIKNNESQKSQSTGGIANAQTILDDKIALYSSLRYFYDSASARGYTMNQVITVTHSEKNLENGKNLLVIGKNKHALTNKIEYILWG